MEDLFKIIPFFIVYFLVKLAKNIDRPVAKSAKKPENSNKNNEKLEDFFSELIGFDLDEKDEYEVKKLGQVVDSKDNFIQQEETYIKSFKKEKRSLESNKKERDIYFSKEKIAEREEVEKIAKSGLVEEDSIGEDLIKGIIFSELIAKPKSLRK